MLILFRNRTWFDKRVCHSVILHFWPVVNFKSDFTQCRFMFTYKSTPIFSKLSLKKLMCLYTRDHSIVSLYAQQTWTVYLWGISASLNPDILRAQRCLPTDPGMILGIAGNPACDKLNPLYSLHATDLNILLFFLSLFLSKYCLLRGSSDIYRICIVLRQPGCTVKNW